jgi:uncharacterized protein (UPF0335 family)
MTNNKVASYAERIERLLDERAAIDAGIKDIYTEVKAADLKPKVLRKAIANKRRKVDKQFEADVEEYAALLLALPGATYRGVAEQTGVSKSKLQRLVPKRARGTEPDHDPETGELPAAGEPSAPEVIAPPVEIPPGEGAAETAKPVKAQAAAPPDGCAVCGRSQLERGHTCLVRACPQPTFDEIAGPIPPALIRREAAT